MAPRKHHIKSSTAPSAFPATMPPPNHIPSRTSTPSTTAGPSAAPSPKKTKKKRGPSKGANAHDLVADMAAHWGASNALPDIIKGFDMQHFKPIVQSTEDGHVNVCVTPLSHHKYLTKQIKMNKCFISFMVFYKKTSLDEAEKLVSKDTLFPPLPDLKVFFDMMAQRGKLRLGAKGWSMRTLMTN